VVDRLLGELITSSLKLGDACTNADAVSKVIDIKDDWTELKGQMSQQASILQEVMRLQQRVASHADHNDWSVKHRKRQEEVESSVRQLEVKLQAHEALVADVGRNHDNVKLSADDATMRQDHMTSLLQEIDYIHSEVQLSFLLSLSHTNYNICNIYYINIPVIYIIITYL